MHFPSAGFGGGDGLMAGIKRKATGESLSLMECQGSGVVYFALDAQDITLVDLNNDTLQVESRQLLAMAGKVGSDLQAIIRRRPREFAELIRQLKDAPDDAILRVVREVKDGNW